MFWFVVDGTARAPCRAGSGGRTVWFRSVGTANTLCCAGLGGRKVWFRADGSAPEPDRVRAVPTSLNRIVLPQELAWHRARAVPIAPNRTVRPSEPARHGARAFPSATNQTVSQFKISWHCTQTVPSALNGSSVPQNPHRMLQSSAICPEQSCRSALLMCYIYYKRTISL